MRGGGAVHLGNLGLDQKLAPTVSLGRACQAKSLNTKVQVRRVLHVKEPLAGEMAL